MSRQEYLLLEILLRADIIGYSYIHMESGHNM